MNVFYNKEGIGDTLIISTQLGFDGEVSFERKGDAARLFDAASGKTVGYNLFQASNYLDVSEKGQVEMNDEKLKTINEAIKKNGFDEVLEADFTPKFVVGYVEEKEKHPNADKLSICKVNVGKETLQIVCGAPNVDSGQNVVVAKVGAVMPSGMLIKDAELRGVASSGMICSAKELNLPNAPQEKGILVLENDKYEAGQPFDMN
ncbi:YtpR family tRNA-binding protein [Bacillus seohaeanensis]|jgi:tRNA-binding protein|uniref:YtpR family tRNA-binding protein n=1 Tax=Bacillus seohaeanensis TaxID=284580 RepID=A0ABW5RT53_9BACI